MAVRGALLVVRTTWAMRSSNCVYHCWWPMRCATRCSASAFQAAMSASERQYDTVMPKPSTPRVVSTPRKPGCCAASSTMRSAISP